MSTDMSSETMQIRFDGKEVCVLDKWKVKVGARIGQSGHLIFTYRKCDTSLEPIGDTLKYKCKTTGIIIDTLTKKEGDLIVPNDVLLEYKECLHNTVMKDLCADCGANINALDDSQRKRIAELTSISMVHSVPELRVSKERAETLGRADEQRLLKDRKLVLLVDLDQTLIHSTNHNVPQDMPNVHHFQLYGPHTPWYHTKFRPHTMDFLKEMSKLFELHICTFGARRYAHSIAHLMDPKEMFFPKDRILSRDECFDSTLKTANMKSLFPCGDSMVCIIDDREDVWNYAPNLVAVKPYICFRDTGDINAPEKRLNDMFGNQEIEITDKTVTLKEFTKDSDNDSKQTNEMTETSKTSDETNSGSEVTQNNISVEKSGEEVDIDSQINEKSDKNVEQKEEKTENNEKESKCESNVTETDANEETPEEKSTPIAADIESSNVSVEDKNSEKKSETDSNSSSDVMIVNNSNEKTIDIKEDNESQKGLDDDNDDYLLYLEEILKKIHAEFYKEFDEKMKYKSDGEEIRLPNLKEIIPRVRKCVLRGVNIVFSGVIPTNIPPEKNKLFNIAKAFGANITSDLVLEGSPKTTHLVASKWGTVKVNKCIKAKNIFIVNPNWLYTCAERWERVDERLYPLEREMSAEKNKSSTKQTQHQTRKSMTQSTPQTQVVGSCATYDPITGKRIRPENQPQKNFLGTGGEVKSSGSFDQPKGEGEGGDGEVEPHNMLEFCPLSGFSQNDLQTMGKEVDDACSEGDELSTGNTDSEAEGDVENVRNDKRPADQSSSDESNDGECPKGWNKNKKSKRSDERRVLELEEVNDSTKDSFDFDNRRIICEDEESTDNESIGSVDEEMALAVEREFLS